MGGCVQDFVIILTLQSLIIIIIHGLLKTFNWLSIQKVSATVRRKKSEKEHSIQG